MSERDYVISKALRTQPTWKGRTKRLLREVGRGMDPKVNAGDQLLGRLGVPRIGEGAMAASAARGMKGYAPEIMQGLRGLARR